MSDMKRLWLSSTGKYHVESCKSKGEKGGMVDVAPTDLYRNGMRIVDRVPWCCYFKMPNVRHVIVWEDDDA